MSNVYTLPKMGSNSYQGGQNTDVPKEQKSSFDEKNYLNTRLAKGEESREVKIRLLTISKDESVPFKFIQSHNAKVSPDVSEGGFKNYICLEKTEGVDHGVYGDKCPFCEMQRLKYEERATVSDPNLKKQLARESFSFAPRTACIVRCIERGKEEEGPKFWKFYLHETNKDDPYHLIKKIQDIRRQEYLEANGQEVDILDLENGKDLVLTITRPKPKEGQTEADVEKKTKITIVDSGILTPLSKDPEQAWKWVNDEKKWSDVFAIKPYDYMKIVLDGGVPYYDRASGKWVPKVNNAAAKKEESEQMEKEMKEADEALKKAQAPAQPKKQSSVMDEEEEF